MRNLMFVLSIIIIGCSNPIKEEETVFTLDGLYENNLPEFERDNSGLHFRGSKVELVGNNVSCDYKVEGKNLHLENIPMYGSVTFEIISADTLLKEGKPFYGTYIKKKAN